MSDLPPNLTSLLDDINDMYSEHMKGAGCCLHITTDDYNIDDSSVDFCIKHAQEKVEAGRDQYGNTHEDCLELAKKIRALTRRERAIMFGLSWCPTCTNFEPYNECCECKGKLVPIPDDAQ
jgi:hypothetical protein